MKKFLILGILVGVGCSLNAADGRFYGSGYRSSPNYGSSSYDQSQPYYNNQTYFSSQPYYGSSSQPSYYSGESNFSDSQPTYYNPSQPTSFSESQPMYYGNYSSNPGYSQQSSCPGGNCPMMRDNRGSQAYYQSTPRRSESYSEGRTFRGQDNTDRSSFRNDSTYDSDTNIEQQDTESSSFYNRNRSTYDSDTSDAQSEVYRREDSIQSASGTTSSQTDPYTTAADDDSKLARRVRDRITSFPEANVSVKGGVITLRGSVRTTDEKTKIERDVRSMSGVRSVNNQLTVRNTSGTRNK